MSTRKDYIAASAAIRDALPAPPHASGDFTTGWCSGRSTACLRVAQNLADHFARDPGFDRTRFMRECGLTADAPQGHDFKDGTRLRFT